MDNEKGTIILWRMKFKKYILTLIVLFRYLLLSFGILLLFGVIYAFTSGPFWKYYRLGTKDINFGKQVDYIIFLGGAGWPSESNLMRAYYTAEIGNKIPGSKIIVAIPGDTADEKSTTRHIANELIFRNIDPERIIFEPEGVNTRSQALNINELIKKDKHIVVVTSPEYMRRSLLCFKKLGFESAGGYPAFPHALESDLSYKNKNLGGNKFVPDVDESISLRYRFWVHLQYEIIVLREYIALAYYKIKGWI